MKTKICCTCKKEKPIECFSKNKNSKDGLKEYCKECASQKARKYREEQKDAIRESARKAYWKSKEKAEEKTRMQMLASSKVCSFCGVEKTLTEFYKCGNGGFRSYCKKCGLQKIRERNLENHDKYLEDKKQYNRRHKKDIDEYNHKYYKEHSEEVKERVKEWERQNPEVAKENQVLYFHRARSRKAGIKSTYTREEWRMCKAYFSENGVLHCAYCGKSMKKASQDHVIPFSMGGENTADNIVPACISCNSSKADKPFEEWFESQPFYSEERKKKITTYLNI